MLQFDQIDAWFLSGELGIAKPNIKIFELISSHFGIKDPQKIIHIGDHVEYDYFAAKNAGMQSRLFIRDTASLDERIPKDQVIKSINEFIKSFEVVNLFNKNV